MTKALKKHIGKAIIGFKKYQDLLDLLQFIEDNTDFEWLGGDKPTQAAGVLKCEKKNIPQGEPCYINFEDPITYGPESLLFLKKEVSPKLKTIDFKDFMNTK